MKPPISIAMLFKLLCASLAVALFWSCPAQAETLKPGDAFPDLKEFALGGALPATLRGKVVLVDFWASWCSPCRASFPTLERLHQKYQKAGFLVVAISVDEDPAAMKRFLEKFNVTFPVAHDQAHKLASRLQLNTMPSSFLLNDKGVVQLVENGFHGAETESQLVAEIERLLPKKP